MEQNCPHHSFVEQVEVPPVTAPFASVVCTTCTVACTFRSSEQVNKLLEHRETLIDVKLVQPILQPIQTFRGLVKGFSTGDRRIVDIEFGFGERRGRVPRAVHNGGDRLGTHVPGRDERPQHERARIRLARFGFVFQFHFLLPEFTALENVMLPMQRLGRSP